MSALLGGLLALSLPPQHYGVYEGLGLLARNMAQGGYELVEGGVYTRTADTFYLGLGLPSVRHALVDLLLGLADEGVEEMVQRIFADRLELMGVLRVARLGAVVVVALPRRPRTGCPLWLALGDISVARHGLGRRTAVDISSARARLHAVGGKGVRYGFLRHDSSIEGCTGGGGDDLRAQRTGGRGVDEAGVPRVLDAVHDGGIAIVGVGA